MTNARLYARRHWLTFQQHDGTVTNGVPTYHVDGDWDTVSNVGTVAVEKKGVTGGEVVRGIQMDATTTHLLIGDYWSLKNVTPNMRATGCGDTFNVIRAYDPDGMGESFHVQVKRDD